MQHTFLNKISKKSNQQRVTIFIFLITLIVLNQNCSKGFQSSPLVNDLSSLGEADCNLPWGGTLVSGASVVAFQVGSVPSGQTCISETRSCSNGYLSGSYQYADCSVQTPNSCTLPWGGTLENGRSRTVYQSSSVPYGQTCISETRSCSNGSLSGGYQYASCMVLPPAGGRGNDLSFQAGPKLMGDASDAIYFNIMMADFTGDGNPDVILTDHNIGGSYNHYWKGDGQGHFTELDRDAYGVGLGNIESSARGALNPREMDFNGDGKLDWAWDDKSPTSLRINTGGGHFTEHIANIGVWGARPNSFYDYNHDGTMDVLYADGQVIDGHALLDDVIGTTPLPSQYVLTTISCSPVWFYEKPLCPSDFNITNAGYIRGGPAVTVADLDGDGVAEITLGYGEPWGATGNEVRIYKKNASGSYDLAVTLPDHMNGYSDVRAADFNNDGLVDIAVAGSYNKDGHYIIYLNHGNMQFTQAYVFNDTSSTTGENFLAVADYDKDGKVDIAVISGQGVQLYKNTTP